MRMEHLDLRNLHHAMDGWIIDHTQRYIRGMETDSDRGRQGLIEQYM